MKALTPEQRRARARLTKALTNDRYFALLDQLTTAVEHPPARTIDVSLRKLARAEFRRLQRRANAVGGRPTDEALHKLRIATKRARYAAELAELVRGKPARKFIAAAKDVQDLLGEHQDAVTAASRIRGVRAASANADMAFSAGRLVERQANRRAAARAALPSAWRRLDRRGRKAWS